MSFGSEPKEEYAAIDEAKAPEAGPIGKSSMTGMLREWFFELFVAHKKARLRLQYTPRWVTTFLDPDKVILHPMHNHPNLVRFFTYEDIEAGIRTEHREELTKYITCYFCVLEEGTTLKKFCKRCIQDILADSRVDLIDDVETKKRITIGKKLSCPFGLGGKPSFHFHYHIMDKPNLINDAAYAIGTIAGGIGYFFTVTCLREEELEAYNDKIFLPHFADPKKCILDTEVTYADVAFPPLAEQQATFGELQFFDKGAAVSFSIPMHPLIVRPDFSPTQTVGVGSLACMTLEMDIYQKLCDDFGEAESTGMPKHQSNTVLLFLDVEEVARNGYPSVMSVNQYNELKTKRLLETFNDAKTTGPPISLDIGRRTGRSTTVTFYYSDAERGGGIVKAQMVSTLVGNRGTTAMYMTRTAHGLFDAHIELYRHFLREVVFHDPKQLVGKFSRFNSVNIRLTDQDMARTYTNAPVNDRKTMYRHLQALAAATDGRVEGATIYKVDEATDACYPVDEFRKLSNQEEKQKEEEELETAMDTSVVSVSSIPHLVRVNAWDAEEPEQNQQPVLPETPVEEPETASPESKAHVADWVQQQQQQQLEPSPQAPSSPDASTTPAASPVTHTSEQQRLGSTSEVHATPEARVSVEAVLAKEGGDEDAYFGPSLRDVYNRCCVHHTCKPNSYLLQKLPDNPRFTSNIEELDMSSNYVGHNGFLAILDLLEHLPRVHTVFFNDMTLDNTDVIKMCEVLEENPSVTALHLRNNPKITLPSNRPLTSLLRANRRLRVVSLAGTSLPMSLTTQLEKQAIENGRQVNAAKASPST